MRLSAPRPLLLPSNSLGHLPHTGHKNKVLLIGGLYIKGRRSLNALQDGLGQLVYHCKGVGTLEKHLRICESCPL